MEDGTLDDIHFNGFFDWFLHIYPIGPLWKNQPTYLIAQASFSLGAALTLLHALRAGGGGRLRYLWPATVLHGFVVESLCYISPDVDNFWHSQTPIMFLGRRLPLHILFLYPCFIYQAYVAAAYLKLPKWAEPFAVGLLVVMIDMPYDITSVKFVHWTWHDTDPNIADRHYWAPWNSYYFHLTFATSFSFWFHAVRRWLDPQTPKWQSSSADKELVSMILAAVLGPVGGVMMFLPLYHPLHDIFHIHSEVTFFILLSVALLVVWTGERRFPVKQPDILFDSCWLLAVALVVHYAVYLGLVCFGHPDEEVSVGFHEPVGPCNLTQPVYTLTGVLKRDKFLCIDNYDEAYFDFHCIPEPPKGPAKWYTVCGTPFENRPEYIAVISIITLVAVVVFWNIYHNSYQATISEKQAKQVKKYKKH